MERNKVSSGGGGGPGFLRVYSILMSNENAPLFRCAYLWPIKRFAKLMYL